jgi:hypothetical protein
MPPSTGMIILRGKGCSNHQISLKPRTQTPMADNLSSGKCLDFCGNCGCPQCVRASIPRIFSRDTSVAHFAIRLKLPIYESTGRTAQMSLDNWNSPSNKLTVCYGNLFVPQLGCSPETVSWTSLALKMWVRTIYNLLRLIRVNHYFPRCNTIFTQLHNLMVNPPFSDLPSPFQRIETSTISQDW